MKKRFLFLAVTFSGLSFLVIPKRKPEQAQADVCGEAARLPFRRNGKQQNRKVLSAAVPPPDEACPKSNDFPPLIICNFPYTEKFILRTESFRRYSVNPRPHLLSIIYSLLSIIYHSPAPLRYSSAKYAAFAPSETAVTTCRNAFVRTSPTANTPGMSVFVVSSAEI